MEEERGWGGRSVRGRGMEERDKEKLGVATLAED